MWNGALFRFRPSLWLGTYYTQRMRSCLMIFVILAWWRTTTEEVGTAWRNFWRRGFCYLCGSWSFGHGISLSPEHDQSYPVCGISNSSYYPSWSDSRIHSSSQTPASDSPHWIRRDILLEFWLGKSWTYCHRHDERYAFLRVICMRFLIVFWIRYHFGL